MYNHYIRYTFFLSIFILLTGGGFYVANLVTQSTILQEAVQNMGILGIVATAFVTGFNIFVPIFPASFAPIFLSAGASYLTVVIGFTIGSSLADSIAYFIGKLGRVYSEDNHPKVTQAINTFIEKHHYWIFPGTYAYMALAPTPNELILIPLALAGYRYTHLLIPLLLGNFIHHSIMVYGYSSVFEWIF